MSAEPSRLDGILTPDGRYLVVRGRLWRATRPDLDEEERSRLVRALMTARRDIAHARRRGNDEAVPLARRRVDRAKVALGERGAVWWTDGAPDENRRMVWNTGYAAWFERAERWVETIDRLLDVRREGASVCPSEVARAEEPRGWRPYVVEVREVARHLARQGHLAITQRGRVLSPDADVRGPIRLRRP